MADVVERLRERIAAWEKLHGANYPYGVSDRLLDVEIETEIETLRARLSQAGAGGVVVRPLEWLEAALMASHGWLTIRMARTPFGIYAIDKRPENMLRVTLCGQTLASCLPATLDEAKAAATADYEARILAALAPSPSVGEPVAWLQTNGDARVLVDSSRRLDDDDRALGWAEMPLYATPPATAVQPTASVEAVEDLAKAAWNAISDGPNQWHCLSLNERDTYVEFATALASLTLAPTDGDEAGDVDREIAGRPLTEEELAAVYAGPQADAAINLIFGKQDDMTIGEVRARVRAMLPSPAPVSAPSPAGGVREARRFDPYILKAMAENYAGGHCWDHLDGQACLEALALIESLQAQVAALSSPATPEQVSAPANGEVVERVAAIIDNRAFDPTARWREGEPKERRQRTARARAREIIAALSNPAPGHGEGE